MVKSLDLQSYSIGKDVGLPGRNTGRGSGELLWMVAPPDQPRHR
jgi:hypothetical protein